MLLIHNMDHLGDVVTNLELELYSVEVALDKGTLYDSTLLFDDVFEL